MTNKDFVMVRDNGLGNSMLLNDIVYENFYNLLAGIINSEGNKMGKFG